MKHRFIAVGTTLILGALAGCQSSGPVAPQATVTPKPAPATQPEANLTPKPGSELNGNWIPTDEAAKGVYVAEFRDGVFVSRSPTTKKPLAKGNYKIVSEKTVDLTFVGAATNTQVQAKCDRQTPSTMYCTPTVGSPFNLRRT